MTKIILSLLLVASISSQEAFIKAFNEMESNGTERETTQELMDYLNAGNPPPEKMNNRGLRYLYSEYRTFHKSTTSTTTVLELLDRYPMDITSTEIRVMALQDLGRVAELKVLLYEQILRDPVGLGYNTNDAISTFERTFIGLECRQQDRNDCSDIEKLNKVLLAARRRDQLLDNREPSYDWILSGITGDLVWQGRSDQAREILDYQRAQGALTEKEYNEQIEAVAKGQKISERNQLNKEKADEWMRQHGLPTPGQGGNATSAPPTNSTTAITGSSARSQTLTQPATTPRPPQPGTPIPVEQPQGRSWWPWALLAAIVAIVIAVVLNKRK